MGRTKDVELAAMNAVAKALEPLDDPTRKRVLAWVIDKWGAGAFQFAAFGVERVAEIHTEPLPPVGATTLGKEQRRG